MPRIAVCSDVHSQADAFEAVLEDARGRDVDEVWCLGDLVGGGPDPCGAVELAQGCDAVLLGNHDAWMLEGRMWQDERALLDAAQIAWLRELRPAMAREALSAWHGSPSDPLNEFLTAQAAAVALTVRPPGSRGLAGHTHEPALWTHDGTRSRGVVPDPGSPVLLPSEFTALANPGAVRATHMIRRRGGLRLTPRQARSSGDGSNAVAQRCRHCGSATCAIDERAVAAVGGVRVSGGELLLEQRVGTPSHP